MKYSARSLPFISDSKPLIVVAALALVALSAPAVAGSALKSVGALEFSNDGTLFVADSEGAAVYAIQTGLAAGGSGEEMEAIEDLDAKLAAMLGASVRDIFIKDLAVHRPSGTAVLSVMRGAGDGAVPVLMKVSRSGELSELRLEEGKYTKLDISDAPGPEAKMGRTRKARSYTVTDLELIDDELYIAGLSNEEFASTLRRAPYPFTDQLESTGLEIYHGAHGKYETHAPIFTFMQYELNGKPHVVASYLCTPLVTFPVEDLKGGEQLRGKTIAELGWGNVPLDMIAYEHEGEEYVLMTNTRRGAMKMKASDIAAWNEKEGITTEVTEVLRGVPYIGSPLGHVLQIADFDADSILVLWREAENGSLALGPRGKQWL
jgi:hypothetical protein